MARDTQAWRWEESGYVGDGDLSIVSEVVVPIRGSTVRNGIDMNKKGK
jgi:hypothetical protein